MTLASRLDRQLARLALPPGPALVAVSGGADSLALLDLLTRSGAIPELRLQVAHCDHGIHPESPRIAEAVRAVTAGFGLPFHLGRLGLGARASETAARRHRYGWLRATADAVGAEVIFTAHHRDDQIETVLMRVLNGSGPAGLAGMAVRAGPLVRPLLAVSRAELVRHALAAGFEPWEDPANRDVHHLRVWIRVELLPILRSRLPDLDRRLLRLARQARAEREAWDQWLEQSAELEFRIECDGVSVAASPLHGYHSGVIRALLGALGRRAGCLLGPTRASRIARLLAGGRSGAVAQLGEGCTAELVFGRLRLFRAATDATKPDRIAWESRPVEGQAGTLEVGGWHLTWSVDTAPAAMERNSPANWFTPGRYLVRPWQPGDRIRPLGGTGRRLVVRCMQDARIARHERAAWPVLETAGALVWVPGVCRSSEHLPAPGTPALRIDAHHR